MTFYSDVAEIATDLITEFGSTVTIERKTDGTFDPVAGTLSGSTTTTISSYAALMNYNLRDSGLTTSAGTKIKMGDKKILLSSTDTSGSSIEPTLNDIIIADSVRYAISNILAIKPSDEDACYFEIHGSV